MRGSGVSLNSTRETARLADRTMALAMMKKSAALAGEQQYPEARAAFDRVIDKVEQTQTRPMATALANTQLAKDTGQL